MGKCGGKEEGGSRQAAHRHHDAAATPLRCLPPPPLLPSAQPRERENKNLFKKNRVSEEGWRRTDATAKAREVTRTWIDSSELPALNAKPALLHLAPLLISFRGGVIPDVIPDIPAVSPVSACISLE